MKRPVLLIVGVLVSGCGPGEIRIWDCETLDQSALARDGIPNPCLTGPCLGACVPVAPASLWKAEPVLLWYGATASAPTSCPDDVPPVSFYAEPASVSSCPLCTCGPPTCRLPVGLNASSGSPACQGPTYTFFAEGPSGACSDNKMMPIAVNGAKSLALLAPTVSPCAPHADTPKDQVAVWGKQAVVCSGIGTGVCDGQQLCAPKAPDGWKHCIEDASKGGDGSKCPAEYPNTLTVYEQLDWKLACGDCACDPPSGSDCTARVSVYADASCSPASVFLSQAVPLGPPLCDAVPANYAVAAMTSTWITDQPGICLPTPTSGQPTGTLEADRSTSHNYCCMD